MRQPIAPPSTSADDDEHDPQPVPGRAVRVVGRARRRGRRRPPRPVAPVGRDVGVGGRGHGCESRGADPATVCTGSAQSWHSSSRVAWSMPNSALERGPQLVADELRGVQRGFAGQDHVRRQRRGLGAEGPQVDVVHRLDPRVGEQCGLDRVGVHPARRLLEQHARWRRGRATTWPTSTSAVIASEIAGSIHVEPVSATDHAGHDHAEGSERVRTRGGGTRRAG